MVWRFQLAVWKSYERRSKKKRRWLSVLNWPCTSLMKADEEESVHRRFVLALWVRLSRPRLSPSLHYFVHFVIKGKEKKQIIFLNMVIVVSSSHVIYIYIYISKTLLKRNKLFCYLSIEQEERGSGYTFLFWKIDKIESLFLSLIIFTNPSAGAGYDKGQFFKRSLTGLNSEFSFS